MVNSRFERELYECFWRAKFGLSIDALVAEHNRHSQDLEGVIKACAAVAEKVKNGTASFEVLERKQWAAHKLTLQIAAIEAELENHPIRSGDADKELKTILELPQVISARCNSSSTIVFRVRAVVPYMSINYHFGDWDVWFGNMEYAFRKKRRLKSGDGDSFHYRVRRVKETRINPEYTDYPAYDYPDGSFCFGRNSRDIEEFASQGELLHAMQVIISSLHHVNGEGDMRKIPRMFKPYFGGTCSW